MSKLRLNIEWHVFYGSRCISDGDRISPAEENKKLSYR